MSESALNKFGGIIGKIFRKFLAKKPTTYYFKGIFDNCPKGDS